jgi:hypothetical protein
MARIAALFFPLALLIGVSGCTWTETWRDYPPSANNPDGQHHTHPVQDQGGPASAP